MESLCLGPRSLGLCLPCGHMGNSAECEALRSQAVTLFVWSVVLWVMASWTSHPLYLRLFQVILTVVAMCVGAVFATCCEDGPDVFLQLQECPYQKKKNKINIYNNIQKKGLEPRAAWSSVDFSALSRTGRWSWSGLLRMRMRLLR